MDEIGKDLTLSNSNSHSPHPHYSSSSAARPPLVFQELLPNAQTYDHHPSYPGKKRVVDENVVEKRKKRLIKNREAAVRSRARRQAYTYELESKVAHLVEQNDKLRKQLEQLRLAADNKEERYPEKSRLNRTLSSPF